MGRRGGIHSSSSALAPPAQARRSLGSQRLPLCLRLPSVTIEHAFIDKELGAPHPTSIHAPAARSSLWSLVRAARRLGGV